MVFPVIVYGCESWTIRKAECWRIDAFELWCWRRLFRVPWTLRRSNQSILKYQPWIFIRRTDADAEAPVLWPPDAKSWFTGKDPDAEKDWRQEEKNMTEDKMVGLVWTQWTWIWANSRRKWRQGKPGVLQSMGSQRVRHDLETEKQLQQHPFYYLRLLPKSGYKINLSLPISHSLVPLKTSL